MGIFDSVGATISSGVSGAISAVETGLASGLSSVSNALSGATSSLGNIVSGANGILSGASGIGAPFKSLSNPSTSEFPLPNPLFDYATYNCILGLAALPKDFLENPDSTYRAGARAPLIAKSASLDPNNRVPIAEGNFEFYIDDLKIHSAVGWENGKNSNAQSLEWKIFEPYSMGQFYEALQVSSQKLGHKNWTDAPYMITIDFYGNKETGEMEHIPKTDRQIPIHITKISCKVTHEGTHYDCEGTPYNQEAVVDGFKNFQSDLSIKGTTVQEMLQSGPKSLESVINQKLRDIADTNRIEKPDKVLILFPNDPSSAASGSNSNNGNSENSTDNSATTAADPTNSTTPASSVNAKLQVSENENQNLVQAASTVNAIGRAKMGFSNIRKGDAPMGLDRDVYSDGAVMNRNKNTIDVNQSDMKFRQDTDILNAINQVILQSEFIDQTLDPSAVTAEGYKEWWNIDTQTYIIGDVNKATGLPPKLLVYRILPYKAHMSSGPIAPNVKSSGFPVLKKEVVKEYNYIYTGKNIDILKFDIGFQSNFRNTLLADGGTANQGVQTQANTGGSTEDNVPQTQTIISGSDPSTDPSIPQSVSYFQTLAKTDKLGGGGTETQATRAARMFHDSVTKGIDMQTLDITIVGDPYYIAMSGTGNYTAQASSVNLNTDGTLNYQTGEVHITVNFRTPVDINQDSGLYNFGENSNVPVASFSGLYRVNSIDNTFSKNQFTQDLHLTRLPGQEVPGSGSAATALSATRKELMKGPDNLSVNNGQGSTTNEAKPVDSQIDPGAQGGGEDSGYGTATSATVSSGQLAAAGIGTDTGSGSTAPGDTEGQQ
jgi:hypothetical protein